MPLELIKEKWSNKIDVVTIGATKAEGGTRSKAIKVGGETGLPYLLEESEMPHKPVIAMEIFDVAPDDWPDTLKDPYGEVLNNPLEWAMKCENEFKADLLTIRLSGIHPDAQNRSEEDTVKLINEITAKVKLPLIILGCGDDAKDNLILPRCAEITKGERCLIGDAVQKNYKTIVAACLAYGHSIIAESPIDINIAKQLNILISEMGLPQERIVINPTVGALGYGMEYAYSIMERARIAAFGGDKMLSQPFICFVGQEAWRAKEAKAKISEFPEWGNEKERGILWEAVTASAFLQAGADILIMRHPKAIEIVKKHIEELIKN
ncbi:MAG: CO dehydrogenase/acetyl-CoA synthase subunit delta [Candidatus Omnitrophica bacterium CG11_big_fil_rev_8_21_14_0_20_42_13]|uniref:CO dehydrogenase/acetyl-CoA synthase subunit delta n=1 Tax=Candidatus Ghiorseimicrobium undicola TaxID=1974746 RepID=A0A2H0M033_9BACT|nr:MAG: CO dehydrogenase/acetyl-CoA synthase subunit delta [Candidatus Omnitrophica bacterium CG11_big_fil_rev_8_21_14_0_20_42_13]